MQIHLLKINDRYVCEVKCVKYHLTFEQLHYLKKEEYLQWAAKTDITQWFNGLPTKEKLLVRPDYISDDDNGFYPDPDFYE